jgi:hypothetical protein
MTGTAVEPVHLISEFGEMLGLVALGPAPSTVRLVVRDTSYLADRAYPWWGEWLWIYPSVDGRGERAGPDQDVTSVIVQFLPFF